MTLQKSFVLLRVICSMTFAAFFAPNRRSIALPSRSDVLVNAAS